MSTDEQEAVTAKSEQERSPRRLKRSPLKAASSTTEPEWASWPDRKLLDLRMCDLDLQVRNTAMQPRIQQLFRELRQLGIRFRPFFWISNEWFTPDGIPGCAIPFYMIHPRLADLERSQVREVEGGTPEWCMRILRHETGHALDNAYRLRRRRRRQRIFGPSSKPYPEFYEPRPYSRSFVRHLEPWYAQSHPDEDFAETFAIWMTPYSAWRQRFANWPAARKLEYIDALMREVGTLPPLVTSRRKVEPLHKLTKTLRTHYTEKRQRYGLDYPHVFDRDLHRLFSSEAEFRDNPTAVKFIAKVRREIMAHVARWTGEYKYIVKQVAEEISKRCKVLGLRLKAPEEQSKRDFTILLAVHTMKYLHTGRNREWL